MEKSVLIESLSGVRRRVDRHAEFEPDLIRLRTREGNHHTRPRQLTRQAAEAVEKTSEVAARKYDAGGYSINDLTELFDVSRPTVYRTLARKPT